MKEHHISRSNLKNLPGKDDVRSNKKRLGAYEVKKLMLLYLKQKRNITGDNIFTSLVLAGTLKSNATSIVGTMNGAHRDIPDCVKQAKAELYSTMVLEKDDITLIVYQEKLRKMFFSLALCTQIFK
ncbi:hypothetical protein HHI36_022211 [Cryptolaemus montrouzieri]|uniref:PiggyBac transposable element-derived protein domain-containing protein n=1 Tax=Cryptolaemus montrouzieri TaxID=559131 RepID=A0ABD2MZE3_9CUCU